MAVANFMKEAMTKPTLELFKFDGNPTAYSRFVSAFKTTVEAVESNDSRKLLYLIQHCTEKAKSLIKYCLLLKPNQGFAKTKQILHENFGKKMYSLDLISTHFWRDQHQVRRLKCVD